MQQGTLKLKIPVGTATIACAEQPQARFENFGPGALSDTELIALILQGGATPAAVLAQASKLIAEAGSIGGLAGWRTEDFRKYRGIGPAKAFQLAALIEISRRMMGQPVGVAAQLNRADLVASYMTPIVRGLEVEKFWVICLNRKNRLKKLVEATSGTASSALAHPREVFRSAVQYSASAIVCVHNHPSGDPAPSAADIQVTRQLREAARTMDIQLLDHIIVGSAADDPTGTGYYSFRAAGQL